MQWQIQVDSVLLIISGVIVSLVAYGLWGKRRTPGAKALSALMLASAVWCLASAIEHAAVQSDIRILASKWQYIGIYSLIPAFVVFGVNLSNTEHRVPLIVRILLVLFPLITILLVFTNEYHGLIWTAITPIPGSYRLVYHHGLWFWLGTGYSYVALLAGSGLVIYAARKRLVATGLQTSVIFLAVAIPWVSNFVYISGLFPIDGLDPTPFAFAISGILFAISIYRFGIFDITPIARDKVVDTMSDLLIVVDKHFQILDINPAAENYFKVNRSAALGLPAAQLFRDWPQLANMFANRLDESTIVRMIQDSAGCWYSLRFSPLQDRQANLTGWMLLLSDITDQRQQAQEIKRLARIIEQTSEAIILTNAQGEIVYTNPYFEQMTGYKAEEVVGKKPSLLKSGLHSEDFYRHLWQTITAGQTWQGHFANRRKDGDLYHESALIFPIKESDGQISHYAAVKHDISDQVRAEQRIQESERRYRLLADNVSDVIWTMDLEGRFTYVSPSVEQLRGFTPEEVLGQSLEEVLTPASIRRILPEFRKIFAAIQSGKRLEKIPIMELEQPCKHGGTIWVETITNIMYGDHGKAVGIVGLTRDITGRKKVQEEIKAYARFQSLLNEITLAAISQSGFDEMLQLLADRMGELLNADGCCIALWDEKTLQVLPGAAYGTLRHNPESDAPLELETTLTRAVLEAGHPILIEDVDHNPYYDQPVAALSPAKAQLALPLIADQHQLGAALISFNQPREFPVDEIQLAEQAANQIALAILKTRLLEEAEHLAIHDPLTGLVNRRHFMELAQQEWVRACRYSSPLSVVMFDIDEFKHINDTYGHLAGDQVIKVVAQKCADNIRTNDVIGRYGGDEFIILLPETPIQHQANLKIATDALALEQLPAKSIATRLRKIIEQTAICIGDGRTITVTISLGIAELDQDCVDIDRLIDLADQALLKAKQGGRNRIVIWASEG